MVRDVVFHLGDRKTGSTSIQSILARQGWVAPGDSIVYPTLFNHIPLAKSLVVPEERRFETQRFARIRTAFDDSDANHGVISAEDFEYVDPQTVRDAIDRHLPAYADRVRLIAYVRPHADRLLSAYAERVKKGVFEGTLDEFHEDILQKGMLLYAPRFEKWRAVFGDRFTLRPFVREALYRSDVVWDFFHYLFGDRPFEITGPTRENESLSVEDIAMLRMIHRHVRKHARRPGRAQQAFGWYMSNFLGGEPAPNGTRPRLHRSLADRVVHDYRDDAAALDAAFFEDTPISDALAATPDKAVEQPQSYRAVDHFSPSERRHFRIWARFLARLIDADPEHFMWAVRSPEQRAPHPPAFRKAGKRK